MTCALGLLVAANLSVVRMAAHHRGSKHPPTLVNFAALFAASVPLLFGGWLIFTASFSKAELIVGAAVAVLGGVALCVTEHADDSHFRPRLRNWVEVIRVLWLVLQGTYEILLVSIRDLLGGKKAVSAFRMTRFDVGESRDLHDNGRRVLAAFYTTMAPNFIVLGINIPECVLVFHQIEKSGVPTLTKNPGAIAA